jgi:hypothetical protein
VWAGSVFLTGLPFHKRQLIENLLDQVDTRDLVMVFTQPADEGCLLVYNAVELPVQPKPHLSILLHELQSANYANYTSLVAGFSAVDVLFPDIPTHGINFFSIDSILRQRYKLAELQQTTHHLAQTIWRYYQTLQAGEKQRLSDRCCAKVVQLGLPLWLTQKNVEGLLAVIMPENLGDFLDGKREPELIYLEGGNQAFADKKMPENRWVATLEEACLFHPAFDETNWHFVELRGVLRGMNRANTLTQTLRRLAYLCHVHYQDEKDGQWLTAAYALAAEAQLVRENVEDLVALYPHQNFERFVETGDALRVYRAPVQSKLELYNGQGQVYTVEDVVNNAVVLGDYNTIPLTLPALEPVLRRLGTVELVDLGPVLWKAGRAVDLVRTFWLTARDMLRAPSLEWRTIGADPHQISDMAERAALIISLLNPWLWRQGRYEQFLQQCYANLVDSLIASGQRSRDDLERAYFLALQKWYGCAMVGNLINNINEMLAACQQYQEGARGRPDLEVASDRLGHLAQIGESIIFLTQERDMQADITGLTQYPFEVDTFLRGIASSQSEITLPSTPFEQRLSIFRRLHNRWKTLQDAIETVPVPMEQFDELLSEYEHQLRVAFAPAHEIALLRYACTEDISRINRFKEAVESGPVVRIRLLNPWVHEGLRENVTFEVENVGGSSANGLRIEMQPSDEFEQLSPNNSFYFHAFPPGRVEMLKFEVRVRGSSPNFNLFYSYKDYTDTFKTHQERFALEVRQAHQTGEKPTGNPFQAGIPVWGSGRFFGRTGELERIFARLVSGITQPILLRGPRRFGKTSLLRQIELILTKPQELRRLGLSGEMEIQLNTIHPVMTTLQSVSPSAANYTARFFQTIYEDICDVFKLEFDPDKTTRLFNRYPTGAFLKQINTLFEQFPHDRLLVMIDEWDELYRPEYTELSRNLRSLMESENRINWIVSSTWTLREELGRYGSPFYNQSFPLELRELEWESGVRLATEPAKQAAVSWHGEAVVALLEQTGRRPYLIQLACSKVIDLLMTRVSRQVDVEVVSAVMNQILKEARTTSQYFGFLWDEDEPESKDSVRSMGRLILWTLDRNAGQPSTRLELRNTLEAEIRRRGFIMPDPAFFEREFNDQLTQLQWVFDALTVESNRYRFSIPLIQRWLHQIMQDMVDPFQQTYQGLLRDAGRER